MRTHVTTSLKRLFGDRGVEIDALGDDDDLVEALEWDSMDVVDLGMEFERQHDVELPKEAASFDTIRKLVAFLTAR